MTLMNKTVRFVSAAAAVAVLAPAVLLLTGRRSSAFEAVPYDTVKMRSGGVYRGEILKKDEELGFIILRPRGGGAKVALPLSDVEEVLGQKTLEEAYARASAEIAEDDNDARLALAKECLAKEMFEAAEREAARVTGFGNIRYEAMTVRARALLAQNRASEALRATEALVKSAPQSAEAWLVHADAQAASGRLNDAIVSFGKARSLGATVPALIGMGRAYTALDRVSEAEAVFTSVLGIAPSSSEAELGLGVVHLCRCRLDAAVEVLKPALEATRKLHLGSSREQRTAAQIANALGAAFYLQGDLENAREVFVEALNLVPDYAPAAINAGFNAALAGNSEEALGFFRIATGTPGCSGRAHIGIGYLLQSLKDVEFVLSEFERGTEESRDDAYCRYAAGHFLSQLSLAGAGTLDENRAVMEQAAEHFRACAELAPGFADVHCAAGAVSFALGSYDEATASYRRAVHAYSEMQSALGGEEKAPAPTPQEEEERAVPSLAEALRTGKSLALAGLAASLSAQGDSVEAQLACREALTFDPDNSYALLVLGYMLEKDRRAREAESCYLGALRGEQTRAAVALEKMESRHGRRFVHESFSERAAMRRWRKPGESSLKYEIAGGKLVLSSDRIAAEQAIELLYSGRVGAIRLVGCRIVDAAVGAEAGLFLKKADGSGIELGATVSRAESRRSDDSDAVTVWWFRILEGGAGGGFAGLGAGATEKTVLGSAPGRRESWLHVDVIDSQTGTVRLEVRPVSAYPRPTGGGADIQGLHGEKEAKVIERVIQVPPLASKTDEVRPAMPWQDVLTTGVFGRSDGEEVGMQAEIDDFVVISEHAR